MTQLYKRKLTAILSADAAGYSRLMGQDEAQTVQTLTAYRNIMAELVKQHRGRVIDSPGDNILAEFVQLSAHIFLTISYTTQRKSMGLDWWGFGEPKEGGQRRTKNRHSHCDRSMQRISILPC
jgi:hypothetical protein